MLLVTMFNKIFVILLLFIFFTLCSCDDGKVLEDLDLSEGADCEWVGVKGKCVKETRCFTTLDKRGGPHPVCSTKGDEKIVCCTDCELINSTRNVVLTPRSDYLWKDGTKARDNCLDYLSNLPYECRWMGGYYTFIRKVYIEEKKCHSISLGGIGGAPAIGQELGIKYPHQGNAGEPLLLSTLYEKCIHMVIGVMSFGRSQCGSKRNFPDVYTKVDYYRPWIESVVWP